jgi:SAM-dependent methyltransferase
MMLSVDLSIGGWKESAAAWIVLQSEAGDESRREILDPCLEYVIGDIAGQAALDVDCGEGRYSRRMAAKGAKVTGIDPVKEFIEHARALHPEGSYLLASGESLPLPSETFDLTLSYLTLIDIPGYRAAIREMARVTKGDGRIVIVTVSNMASVSDGWIKDAEGKKLFRAVDRYMEEFELDLSWAGLRIINYHRPMSAILGAFFESGLVMDGFWEPLPPVESANYESEFRVPNFQVMSFRFGSR